MAKTGISRTIVFAYQKGVFLKHLRLKLRFMLAAWKAYGTAREKGIFYFAVMNSSGNPEAAAIVGIGRDAWMMSRAIEELNLKLRPL